MHLESLDDLDKDFKELSLKATTLIKDTEALIQALGPQQSQKDEFEVRQYLFKK